MESDVFIYLTCVMLLFCVCVCVCLFVTFRLLLYYAISSKACIRQPGVLHKNFGHHHHVESPETLSDRFDCSARRPCVRNFSGQGDEVEEEREGPYNAETYRKE